MSPLLGGPGVACSVTTLRRLEAGELRGDERERVEAHLAGCARCRALRASFAEEARALHAQLPFPDFAAGVAEKLARDERAARSRRRWAWRAAVPLALAACLAAVLVTRAPPPPPGPSDQGDRPKGDPTLTVHVRDGGVVRVLAPEEPVPRQATLRLALQPAGRRWAAVLFRDADGVSVLYAGPALDGELPGAFEWTGGGRALLIVVLDDSQIDAAALRAQAMARGPEGVQPRGSRARVLVRELRRLDP